MTPFQTDKLRKKTVFTNLLAIIFFKLTVTVINNWNLLSDVVYTHPQYHIQERKGTEKKKNKNSRSVYQEPH